MGKTESSMQIRWMAAFVLVVIVAGVLAYLLINVREDLGDLKSENRLLKAVAYYDTEFFSSISESFAQASSAYDDAVFYQEQRDWKSAERSCFKARELYQKNSQEVRELKEGLASQRIDHPIVENYLDLFSEQINIDLSMFEACEYYEAAYRFYDVYFNTEVPYDDPSYYSATDHVDLGNEKIAEHDAAVKRQNDVFARINIEWKKIFEES